MILNSAITDWTTRETVTRSTDLLIELRTPISKRKKTKLVRNDPYQDDFIATQITLGLGCSQRRNSKPIY